MSASSKKKLRKEQEAVHLTQKQRQQQSEAKKLKTYTVTFVVVLALIVAIALGTLAVTGINRSGYFQKNTIGVTLNGHQLNNVALNYYFVDAVQNQYDSWYQSYGTYMSTIMQMYGLDLSKPLDKQIYDADKNITWAAYFMETAIENARYDYAMYDLAQKEQYKLSDDEQEELDTSISTMQLYAAIYGYKGVDQYLEYTYGFGSTAENYKEYLQISTLAKSFYQSHYDSRDYDDAAIREYESTRYNDYTSYSYTQIYIPYRDFLTDGTKDEDGKVTYSDAEIDAAVKAAKAAAETLLSCKTSEDFDAAIKKIEQYKEYKDEDISKLKTEYTNTFYGKLVEAVKEWVSNKDRKEGEITVIENTIKSTDADGKETTSIGGYYVVLFGSSDENKSSMGNVRHLLVKFTGGTKDDDGNTVYSDAEKKKALDLAEQLLKQWKEGKMDEDSFIEMVKENSDDSSASTGGLFEDIHRDSNYVTNFKNWALDSKRQEGDVEIVETEYGYHIMYYVGTSELTYRDFMIFENLRDDEMTKWKEEAVESTTVVNGNTKYVNTGMTLA